MHRYALISLFLLVLLTPFALRWSVGAKAGAGAGRGRLTLVVMTPHQEMIRREFADAFSDWHRQHHGQGVFIDYRSYGAADIVKYFEAARGPIYGRLGTYKVDVVWGGGDYLFDAQLKKPGYLEPVDLGEDLLRQVYPQPDLAGVDLYDRKDHAWFGTALSSFGIVYNKDVARHLGVSEPKTWRDLADPRWDGWIVLADPTRSSSAKMAYMILIERAMADAAMQGRSEDDGWADGMGLVRQIAASARQFVDSGSVPAINVSSGEAGAGMAIDFFARSQVDAVGSQRMGYVEPPNATAINPDPIALVKGAPQRELAIRFICFVLSEEGQRLWNTRAGAPGGPRTTSLRRLPVLRSAYQDMSHFTDPVNPFEMAGGFNKSSEREKTFGIIGELIQYSCIDLLEELQATRRAIRASKRPAELDARLGRFPFDQKEALRRLAAWKSANAATKLRLGRQWTAEFREEYRLLRQEAAR